MSILNFLILSFCLLTDTNAQFDILKHTVQNQYADIDSKLAWEKQMKGQIDDQTTVYLYLLTDSKSYFGAYAIEGSDEIHLLEGEQTENDVLLLDFSIDHQLIGTINGDFADHVFYATWINKNKTEELSFITHEINSITKNQSWTQSFGDENDYFLISKLNNNYALSGYFNGRVIESNLSCDNDCNSLYGDINSESIEESTLIRIDFTQEEISVNYGSAPSQQYKYINKVSIAQIEDNTNGRAYAYHPIFENNSLTNQWSDYGQQIDKIIGTEAQFRSSLDVNFDYLGKRYASGILRYQNNQSSPIQELSFIIDFKKNKVTDPRKMFKEIPNQDDIFKTSHNKINIEDCTYSFGTSGIIIRSPFNLLYGQETVVLPFKDFKTKKLN